MSPDPPRSVPLLLFWKSSSCGAGLVPVLNSQRAHLTAGWETCWRGSIDLYFVMMYFQVKSTSCTALFINESMKTRASETGLQAHRRVNVCILVSEANPTLKPSTKAELWGRLGAPLWWKRGADRCWEIFCLLFLCCFRSSFITLWDASSSSSPPSSPRRRAVERRRWWPDRYVSAQLRDSRCVALQQTSSVWLLEPERVLRLTTQDVTLSLWSRLNFSERS